MRVPAQAVAACLLASGWWTHGVSAAPVDVPAAVPVEELDQFVGDGGLQTPADGGNLVLMEGDRAAYEVIIPVAGTYLVSYQIAGAFADPIQVSLTMGNVCNGGEKNLLQSPPGAAGLYVADGWVGPLPVGLNAVSVCAYAVGADGLELANFALDFVEPPYPLPGGVPAIAFDDIYDEYVGDGPVNADFNVLASVVGTERMVYTVETEVLANEDEGKLNYFEVSLTLSGAPQNPVTLQMRLVPGGLKSCDELVATYATAILDIKKFDTNGWEQFEDFNAGFIGLPQGESEVTLCVEIASDVFIRSINFVAMDEADVPEIEPIPTPPPPIEEGPYALPGFLPGAGYSGIVEVYVGNGPVTEDGAGIGNIVAGEAVTYTVTSPEMASYTLSYAVKGTDDGERPLTMWVAKGSGAQGACADEDAMGLATNSLNLQKYNGMGLDTVEQLESKGFITLPKGNSQITVCVGDATGIVLQGVTLEGSPTLGPTPAPTPPPMRLTGPFAMPGRIEAEGYDDYVDVYVGGGTLTKDKKALTNIVGGEIAYYTVIAPEAGNYNVSFELAAFGPEETKGKTNAYMYIENGISACQWSEELVFLPQIDVKGVTTGSLETFEIFYAMNNAFYLPKGESEVTLCILDASYTSLDAIVLTSTDALVQEFQEPQTGLVMNNIWLTMAIILGGGFTVGMALCLFRRRKNKY
jgi:hypothetical protein